MLITAFYHLSVSIIFHPLLLIKDKFILVLQVFSLSDIKIPDEKNPFHCSYDSEKDILVPLRLTELSMVEDISRINELLVPTSNLLVTYTVIQQWLHYKEHVMLVGPEASGKRYYTLYYCILNHALYSCF